MSQAEFLAAAETLTRRFFAKNAVAILQAKRADLTVESLMEANSTNTILFFAPIYEPCKSTGNQGFCKWCEYLVFRTSGEPPPGGLSRVVVSVIGGLAAAPAAEWRGRK